MLPDYTSAKARLHDILMKFLQERVHAHLGPFALKEYRAFEGRAFATTTDTGKRIESSMKEISGKIAIKFSDVQSGNPQLIRQHLDNMAKDIADGQTKGLFETLNKTCEETGQTVDFKGQQLSPEVFLKSLESIFIEFDDEGKAHDLMFIISPRLAERTREMLKELESDPKWKQQHDELINRKRMEWHDREASRKLVG